MANGKRQGPTHKPNISDEKKPRKSRAVAASTDSEPIVWGLARIDNQCQWAWCDVDKATFWGKIFPRLGAFESMTWTEAFGRANHAIPIHKLEPAARRRLEELQLDDRDRLYRLSVQGLPRIWGVREGAKFCVLWYDATHSVYITRGNR